MGILKEGKNILKILELQRYRMEGAERRENVEITCAHTHTQKKSEDSEVYIPSMIKINQIKYVEEHGIT